MEITEYGRADAPVVLIQPVDDHDLQYIEHEIEVIRDNAGTDFRLITVKVNRWNTDLSPWKAPAVFGREEFGGGAAAFLEQILELCNDSSKTYIIGGYSLAGLFALWASCQTDVFRGVAAASPSVWFPGFDDYMQEQPVKSIYVYLSLGNKEEKTRNPVMATVGDRIRTAYDYLKTQTEDCILEWNEGNHFKDADLRTARAFLWVMKH